MNKINPFKLRSFLFVPAIKEKFIEKLFSLEGNDKPDVVIFDLEDSVHPEHKLQAREILSQLFDSEEKIGKLREKYVIALRVNRLGSKWFDGDIALANKTKPTFLMIPKIEDLRTLKTIRRKAKQVGQFIAIVETISGYFNLEQISRGLDYYDLLAVGPEDFSSDLLVERPSYLQPNPLNTFFNQCLYLARKREILLLDGPSRKFQGIDSLEQLKKECHYSLNFGFSCKMAIHPTQIPIINSTFDKTRLVAKAENLLKSFDKLDDGSLVIVNEESEMMDTPSYKMYKKIIDYWSR